MSCCGGKHIFMIPVTQLEDVVPNRIKVSNEENREVVWLEHLVGGSLKVYTVQGQKYAAGGKYRFVEVYKEHVDELLRMKKLGRSIFRISQIESPVLELTTENGDDESTQEIVVEEVVVDLSELKEGDIVEFENGSIIEILQSEDISVLELTEESTQKELVIEKTKNKRKNKVNEE